MKIGVSSYSFSRLTRAGKMTQLGAVKKAAEMGFQVIEFAGLEVPEGDTPLSYAAKLREACAAAGIGMGNYSIPADFLYGSDGDLDAEVERLTGELRVARALGAPGMRHDAAYGYRPGAKTPKGFADALPRLAKGCRAVTERAAELGIRTMVENHGFFCQDSRRVEALINRVGHENFGALIDMGNFLCADEDPAQAVARLAPYQFHAHVKDFHFKPGTADDPGRGWFRTRAGNYLRGAIIGHGVVPVRQCLRLMREAGYDGTFSVEFEGMEDPVEGVAIGLENLKGWLGGLSAPRQA